MGKVIFSSWGGKVIDNRGLAPEKYASTRDLELRLQWNGHHVGAFMSWKGFVVGDGGVNVVDMTRSYLKEVQRLSCGECTMGYSGVKVMLDILTRIASGGGAEEDIELLERLGSGIKRSSKCDFCASAVTPVLDSVNYYKEQYLKLIASKQGVPESSYMVRITAPCMEACPAHQDAPGYIELIRNRRYEESLQVVRKTNVWPGVTGRACVAFCESACTRASIDSPIAIRALKRFAADSEIAGGLQPEFEKVANHRQRVAIIGAGPAGLAASYSLALMGYKVTIYDEQLSAGGMALVGIPPYRLPKDILEREIDIVKNLGVVVKLNTRIGKDVTVDQLSAEGFKAIFIATGAHLGREFDAENWKEEYPGLIDGVKFLREFNLGNRVAAKNNIIIVGGGNVAVDCARTCLRLGFKNVTIVYRRSRAEMPARKEEVEDAEKEGVKITFLATPVRILAERGKVTGAECIKMELGEPDASGRKRPIPIKGSEFTLETDMVLSAIGEKPDLSFLTDKDRIEITPEGAIKIGLGNGQTSKPGVFSGGDCVTGPATLIEAIAAGNRAARSIDQYFSLGKVVPDEQEIISGLVQDVDLVPPSDRGVAKSMPQYPEQLSLADRLSNFNEVEKCLSAEAAAKEAERCLRCYRVMLLAASGK